MQVGKLEVSELIVAVFTVLSLILQLNQEGGKEGKKQEDIHSDMSAETATYDSGIGGSVSDTGTYYCSFGKGSS